MKAIQFDRELPPDHAAAVRQAWKSALDDGGPLILGPDTRILDIEPTDFGLQDRVELPSRLDELAVWIAIEGVLLIILSVVVIALLIVTIFR